MKFSSNKLHKKLLTLALALCLMVSLAVPALAAEVDINSEWKGAYYGNEIYYRGNGNGAMTIPSTYTNAVGERAYVHYVSPLKKDQIKNITTVSTSAALYSYPYFCGATSLTSVDIPVSVGSLYGNFSGCTALKNVNFINVSDNDPDRDSNRTGSLLKLQYDTFAKCTSLESISLPGTIYEIGDNAFTQCSSLKNVTFPKSLKKIGSYAFDYCKSLKSISLPSSLELIGPYAFNKCSLESVTIPASVKIICDEAFSENPKLNSITFCSDESASTLVDLEPRERYTYDPFKIEGVDNSTRTIYGPVGGLVEKFAKHWGYSFNSAPAEEKGFTFGVDTYSFGNYASSFGSAENTYKISDELLAMLTDGYPKSFIAEIKENMNKPLYGMCFGMTTTAALFYTGELSQSSVQQGATTTYSLSAPSSNESLRELLAFYQLSQFQQSIPAYNLTNETPNNLALVNALQNGSDPVVLLGTLTGRKTFNHAMIAYELEETENGYEIKVYDPNHPKAPLTLHISEDGKTSDFKDTYSSIFVKDSLTKSDYSNIAFQSYVSSGGLIKLTTNYDSMTISDGEKTATIENGVQTGGDLPVNCYGPQNEAEETSTFTFTFEQQYSDGGLVVEPVAAPNDGAEYKAQIQSDDKYDGSFISVSSENNSAITVKRGGEVGISGNKSGKFRLSSTANKTNGELYTITAEGNDSAVSVTPSTNGGKITTANNSKLDVKISGSSDAVKFDKVDVRSNGADIKTDGGTVELIDSESGETLAKGIATDEENEFLEGFVPSIDYKDGEFSDISKGTWYEDCIKLSYQLGILNGKGHGYFDPEGNITIAQAIKMACVVHSAYYANNADLTAGEPWYQVYIDYAIKNGIISAGQFTNYDAYATRAEMAAIFANGVSSEALPLKNEINSLPDVEESSPYGNQIYMLYRAGVLTGNDQNGSFAPNTYISRAQAAAIITRIAVVSQRRSVTF